jgi:hypothetical protein
MLARVVKRAEYKIAGESRIIDPRVWNDAQEALARRRKHHRTMESGQPERQ